MELELLKSQLRNEEEITNNHFDIVKQITSIYNNSNDQDRSVAQDLVLRAMDKYEYFGESQQILDSLIRELGLFPYLEPDSLSIQDLLAYEAHKISIGDKDIVFHGPQSEVFYKLLEGKSVVLSAPTSFGKSLIIDALIASNKFSNIVIVVPTISLIDETRRRLSKFNSDYKIITHSIQKSSDKNIYVLTQERVLEEDFIGDVDFFVIDEFYKLSPWSDSGDGKRCALLNQAFYNLYKKCNHFYMLGPNIEGVAGEFIENVKFEFIKFGYKTVVTEFHDYTTKEKEDKLLEISNKVEGQTIIFCSSPDKANKVVQMLCELPNKNKFPEVLELAEWLSDKYHQDWILTKALLNGICVHHSRIPRGISQYFVDLFNDGKIKFLVCTSTLIEGVNTSTQNIICFDDKINRKNLDIFTFNNIAGRCDRMFKHFIGNVYLLSPRPYQQLPFVDVPIYSQSEDTDESLLINIDKNDLSDFSYQRIKPIVEQNDLSIEIIRANKSIDPSQQLEFARELKQNWTMWSFNLLWKGYPKYEQLLFICKIIWDYFEGNSLGTHSVHSYKQLAYKINQLHDKKSVKALIAEAKEDRPDDSIDLIIDRILNFRRLWANHHFPRLLRAIGSIINDVGEQKGLIHCCDYSAYSTLVENYHYDISLVALEEYGLPLEVSQKLERYLSTNGDLDQSLLKLKKIRTIKGASAMDLNFIARVQKGI